MAWQTGQAMRTFEGAVKGLVLIALLALWGCGKQSLSVSDYHHLVIQTLNANQSQPGDSAAEGSSFAAMISLLITDMDCMGDTCINGLRFTHLRDLADQDRPYVANYRGGLCDEKKLRPPPQEAKAHQEICNALERIFREMDAIRTTSDAALLLLRGSQTAPLSPAVQTALEGASTNLARSQQRLTATLTGLQEIAWLKPALPHLP